MENKQRMTGYPSMDKPWMKYYSEKAINAKLPECSLYEYLYENNKDYPNDIALEYFGRKITYSELFKQIDAVAKAFLAQEVKPGDVVTIVSLSCVTSVLCFYALNKIGAVSNYINVLSSQKELEKYFSDVKGGLVVTLDFFGEKVIAAAQNSSCTKVIVYSLFEWMPMITKMGFRLKTSKKNIHFMHKEIVMSWNSFLKKGKNIKFDGGYCKNACKLGFLAHTGGTTGFPKSVLISDKAMNAVAHQYNLCMNHERGQVFLGILMPFVMYGILIGTHMPLCLGLTLSIIPRFEICKWSQYLIRKKPNHIAAIPAILSPMLEDKTMEKVDLSDLITVASGGDGMDISLENKMNIFLSLHGSKAKIIKGYGLTEVCATAVTSFSNCNKIGSVGIPLVKNNVKIFNGDKHSECYVGQTGEICLLCPSIMLGYKSDSKDDETLLYKHDDGKYWLHTGDLGYMDEDGFLFLVGRLKRQIVVWVNGGAYKVYPNQIEEVILTSSEISNACVVGIKHNKEMLLKVFLVLENNASADIETELRNLCQKKLPDYMCPTFYEFVEALPLSPSITPTN